MKDLELMICPQCNADVVVDKYHSEEQCYYSACLSKTCNWFETRYIGKINPKPIPHIEGNLPRGQKVGGILI